MKKHRFDITLHFDSSNTSVTECKIYKKILAGYFFFYYIGSKYSKKITNK